MATELRVRHGQAAGQAECHYWRSGTRENNIGKSAERVYQTVLAVRKGLEWKDSVFKQNEGLAWEEKWWNIQRDQLSVAKFSRFKKR